MKERVIKLNPQDPETGILHVYPASHPNGKAVVMCPGGGFKQINGNHEGADFAAWFNERGITYAWLSYRLPKDNSEGRKPIEDLRLAIRYLQYEKNTWGICKTGVMGASIGGYIAGYASTYFFSNDHPEFQILLYPIISMTDDFAHIPTRDCMLGEEVSDEKKDELSLELHVQGAPPTFIALADDDNVVNPEASRLYCKALKKDNTSASLFAFPIGGHSFGFNDAFPFKEHFLKELDKWLKTI